MGSAAGATEETVEYLRSCGEKVGLLKVRLYRPFAADAFLGGFVLSHRDQRSDLSRKERGL